MPLWRVSVKTSARAEEAVTGLLEEVFQQPAWVFVDAQNQTITGNVYASKAADVSATNRAVMRAGLGRLKAVGLLMGPARLTVTSIRREDWAESWKRHFKPIEIGSALLLKPSWSKRRPKKRQAMVVLDPGLSFGTGQHPTTRFCLAQLVAVRKQGTAQSFLDIGTGSGILAISAARLGYHPVMAIDSDPESIRVASANAKLNRVQTTVDIIRRDLSQMSARTGGKSDLVCANLIFDLLLAERKRIVGCLKPGGVLVLAGILRSQFPAVRTAYEEGGLRLLACKAEKEWSSGAFGEQD